ncbi:MAG: hypothetical protein AABX47_01485 [Nanoarchaeota archaeon]|mgnify:CR=1 FL=1
MKQSDPHKAVCRVCNKKSKESPCENCAYLIKNGASEETIKKMLGDKRVNKIWEENKETTDSTHSAKA